METIDKIIATRAQQIAESLLGNEGLTDNLDDEAANVLLNWGTELGESIAKASAHLDDEAAEEAMYPQQRALRRMLRDINRWIPKRADMDPAADRVTVEKVLAQAKTVYPKGLVLPDEDARDAFVKSSVTQNDVEVIRSLRALLEQGQGHEVDETLVSSTRGVMNTDMFDPDFVARPKPDILTSHVSNQPEQSGDEEHTRQDSDADAPHETTHETARETAREIPSETHTEASSETSSETSTNNNAESTTNQQTTEAPEQSNSIFGAVGRFFRSLFG
ncbi:MAG: hypothetical protein AAF639_46255 [Chloroflexota bacterium]